MEGKKKRYASVFAAFMIAAGMSLMTGCTKDSPTGASVFETDNESKGNGESKPVDNEELLKFVTQGSSDTMVEAGKNLFFKYKNTLWRIDKTTDQADQLKVFKENESGSTFWVYNNNLYYDVTESTDNSASNSSRLFKMDLDTLQEEVITELSSAPASIYASGGILYVKGYQILKAYQLTELGTIDKELSLEDTIYGKIPEDCTEDSGTFLPETVERFGYMALSNGESLVIADKDGQNAVSIPEIGSNMRKLFTENAVYAISQDEEQYFCQKVDLKTLEQTKLFETKNYPTLLQYRDGFLYCMENDSYSVVGGDNSFYKVDVEDGSRVLSMKLDKVPGATTLYSYYGSFYVTEDSIYSERIQDYDVRIEKISLLYTEDRSLLETTVYPSFIGELGSVEAETRNISCACGEKTAEQVYVERLVVDQGNTEADDAINRVLEQNFVTQLSYISQPGDIDEALVHDENFTPYSMTDTISSITYLDDNYFCLEMNGYEYSGGAHGMPYKSVFIFDRNTGKQLTLKDIIDISEEGLKKTVSGYFRELSEATGFSFSAPAELEQEVAESVTMDSPFYLTKEGIVFYYWPYEIGPYAAGFPEVTIPYSEFTMKVDLRK